MATQVQRRRGTAAQNDAFTGALGEFTYDETNHTIRVHDGATQGGWQLIVKTALGTLPFVGSWKCKVKYDAQGLITDATDLDPSDIPDISATYATQVQLATKVTANAAITAGAYTKVNVDEKGLVTAGGTLLPTDIPDISGTYAKKMAVVTPVMSNGVWTLEANKVNKVVLSASATFSLPTSASLDLTILNQIIVQLKMVDAQQINLGTTNYLSGVAPDLSQAGVYNIYFEWDNNDNAWYVGAVLKKAL
jgi:hypothetical protein